jgi:lipopolysaccharide/colanic/teichoic acid biosynthesis glycosyltransferase
MRLINIFGNNKIKKAAIILSLIFFFLLSGLWLKERLTFAFNYLDSFNAAIDSNLKPNDRTERANSRISPLPLEQTARVPEPSTLILFLSGLSAMAVRFARKSFNKFKRVCDALLSMSGLIVASPILAFTAIMIKLNSRGPIVYRQNRVGRHGKVFKMYKLRTMNANAEKETGAVWARGDDPRVTSVGRVLRKTHIDEIPQLVNVLKGEMSLVGPRPERPEIVQNLKPVILDYEKRLQVTPGITGFAQVWHKYDETIADVKKKIKYDLLYIRKMCLLTDLGILMQTLLVVLTGRGAR